jgi:hypothetical protein
MHRAVAAALGISSAAIESGGRRKAAGKRAGGAAAAAANERQGEQAAQLKRGIAESGGAAAKITAKLKQAVKHISAKSACHHEEAIGIS